MIKNILKHKLLLTVGLSLIALFVLFTILIKTVDVAVIGESLTEVGLSSINNSVYNSLGSSDISDKISDVLLILSFGVGLAFCALGAYRLFKEKRLDLSLVILGAFYVALLLAYVIFDHIHFNYAPLLKDGMPKESYPSSHVLASVFVFLSAIIVINENIKNKKFKYTLVIAMLVLAVLMVLFRLLSGWHWFSDILCGELLALALVSFYAVIVLSLDKKYIEFKKEKKEEHEEELH